MQTRIIQTRFYKDNEVRKLTLFAQHLFLYLLTSEHINISGIFELPDDYICLEAKLTPKQLEDAKKELSSLNKVLFFDGWVKVVNAEKNNKYRNSPKNETAYQREIERIPARVLEYFNSSMDTSIDSSIDTTHKPETRNQKSEIEGVKGEILEKQDLKLKEIVIFYNEVFGKNVSSVSGFEKNYQYWITVHNIEKIKQAIQSARNDKFWKDKLTLQILFRKKNPRGEDVDYIEDLSNRTSGVSGNIALI